MANKFDIHIKGGFSERKGLKKFSDLVQITSLDTRTRNKIYSAVQDSFLLIDDQYNHDLRDSFCEYLYEEIFSLTKNHIPQSNDMFSSYDYNEIFQIEVVVLISSYTKSKYASFSSKKLNMFSQS